jgi:hypothetical protein
MLRAILSRKKLVIVFYFILVTISIGMGMGVPFFTILLGFPVGWLLPDFLDIRNQFHPSSWKKLINGALVSSSFSLALLCLIWLPALKWLFDPALDPAQFGMPLILYEPLASFIAWMVLMVVVSPILQFLVTVLGLVLRLVYSPLPEIAE